MPIPLQKFREIVFQLLFCQTDLLCVEEEDVILFMMEQLSVSKKSVREAFAMAKTILTHLDWIDEKIRTFARSYEFERIAQVEKTTLRLAIYEMCYNVQVPAKVAISEAIRLTRKFSVGESSSFVNAVLDAILKDLPKAQEEEHVCFTPISITATS